MSETLRPRYSVSTAASEPASRSLISSMTATLRWICALDASALVGMLVHLFRRVRDPLPAPTDVGARPEVLGDRLSAGDTSASARELLRRCPITRRGRGQRRCG